ncbi:MAG TPA: N-acetyltransferase [Thermoanaerobaculia bacterium]|jgi:ribosomal protein S18 acetylase RimI-like enzyme|nr:N-acetyltransferase [Thermoanaerobaculia bacterium]
MRERISFRPETDDDKELLYGLYASTRAPEMEVVPWTDEEKEQFLRMQFHAQTLHYKNNYVGAVYSIILVDGAPAGRLYLHEKRDDVRIMDIVLAPEYRGTGVGSIILADILERAAAAKQAVSIHVEQYNPAMRLYERLGFQKIDEHGVYWLMEWRPEGAEPAAST